MHWLRLIFALWLLTVYSPFCRGQLCTNRYASIIYKTGPFDTITHTITSRANDIVAVGNIDNDHGFAAKFSEKGTPLFSYQYNPVYQWDRVYFAKLQFSDIVQTKDGGFVLAGKVIKDKFIGQLEYVNSTGVLLRIDAFGNVVWCKRLESDFAMNNNGFQLALTNVVETSDGSIAAYVASYYGRNYPAYGRIICFDKDGKYKWNTLRATNDYDGGKPSLNTKRGMITAANGSLVVCDLLYKSDRSGPDVTTLAAQTHFFSLNPQNGKLNWETNYNYPHLHGTNLNTCGIIERANGELSFYFSTFSSSLSKGVRIQTDNKGILLSASRYGSNTGELTQLIGVKKNQSGEDLCLLKKQDQGILGTLSNDGSIRWQKGFSTSNGLFPVNTLTIMTKGIGIFCANYKTQNIRLLLTDTTGYNDCANTSSDLAKEDFILERGNALLTEPNIPDQNRVGIVDFPIRAEAHPLEKRIECQDQGTCCVDITDSSRQAIEICEGSSYTLPDNTIVRQSGVYYILYKTLLGCDSIVYYPVHTHKNPSQLSLGDDLCMEGKDSVLLQATGGYEGYSWMNRSFITDSSFKAPRPGMYWVTVSNSCGTKTDSLEVHAQCDFETFMPSAFTPNNDRKNDVYKFPEQNKNRLISLKIFNRWGQLIFSTKNRSNGWDGKYTNVDQPSGVYAYVLEVEGLSGKHQQQKGTFLLIR